MARRRTAQVLSFSWKREAEMASARQRFLARIATGSSVVLEEGRSMAGVTRYSMVFAVVAAAVIGALALTL